MPVKEKTKPTTSAGDRVSVRISSTALQQALNLAARAVASRAIHPVLANLKFEASEGQLKVTGYDFTLGIEATAPAAVSHPFAITISASLLSDLVGKLPDGEIELSLDGTTLAIACGNGNYKLAGIEAEEYPEFPTLDIQQTISIEAGILRKAIALVLHAAATDESKMVLTGVHIKNTNSANILAGQEVETPTASTNGSTNTNKIEFAATDGHRLAIASFDLESEISPIDLTIPARALAELDRAIKGLSPGEKIGMAIGQGHLAVELENLKMLVRLPDSQYPNYRQLIPNKFETKVTCDRRSLLSAIERVSIMSDPKKKTILLEIGKETLTVSAETEAGKAKEEVAIVLSSDIDSIDLCFNSRYLIDALKVLPTEALAININQPTNPVVFTPMGGKDAIEYLLMSIQIR